MLHTANIEDAFVTFENVVSGFVGLQDMVFKAFEIMFTSVVA